MKDSLLLYVKGMAMGAVDVVPGFSGGTVALIMGIYDRLLRAFSSMPAALVLLLKGQLVNAWKRCDATFVLIVLLGILTSVFTLAKAISFLMVAHPVLLWAFFFGLVLVSVYLVGREVRLWSWPRWINFILGLAFAIWITTAAPLQLEATPWMLFFAGAIAISAMILPGISGSFILVLLGLYPVVLGAVKNLDIAVLVVFCAGCLLGLLSFSKLLSWLLEHTRDMTMAFLAGLMLGSLGKVWPWKHTLTWQTNSAGERYPLLQENVLPGSYAQITGLDAQFLAALALSVLAVVLVLAMEWYARKQRNLETGVVND